MARHWFVIVVAALVLGAGAVPAYPAGTFANPLDQHGPDPWLQYHDGSYYLAATTWNNTITMRKSRTLGGLASAPDTVIFNLTRPNGAGTMWAPEFHLLNGPNGLRWYFYYTAGQEPYNLGTQRIHVLESAGLPLDPSFAEQKKIFERCNGLFYSCAGGAEARRFNRLLIDAGLIRGL